MKAGRKKSPLSETKNNILYESEKLFAEKGFDATSIDHISKKVGITKAAIYYHFQNKQEIMTNIIDNFIRESLSIQKQQNEVINGIMRDSLSVQKRFLASFKRCLSSWIPELRRLKSYLWNQ